MKKIYARVGADHSILEVVERETAPGHVNHCVWVECYDTGPAHHPDLHERHNFEVVWEAGQVVRRFQIRRKADG
jgi:hypothetical protein